VVNGAPRRLAGSAAKRLTATPADFDPQGLRRANSSPARPLAAAPEAVAAKKIQIFVSIGISWKIAASAVAIVAALAFAPITKDGSGGAQVRAFAKPAVALAPTVSAALKFQEVEPSLPLVFAGEGSRPSET
jgi:hypothetical protein